MKEFWDVAGRYWSALFIGDPTPSQLMLLSAIGFFALLLFSGIISGLLFKSRRGMLPFFAGMVLALGVFLVCAAAGEIYLQQELAGTGNPSAAYFAIGIAGFLIAGVLLAKALMGISWGGALFALILCYAASFGAVVLSQQLLEGFTTGARALGEGQERRAPQME